MSAEDPGGSGTEAEGPGGNGTEAEDLGGNGIDAGTCVTLLVVGVKMVAVVIGVNG